MPSKRSISCAFCGVLFTARRPLQKYCGLPCSQASQRAPLSATGQRLLDGLDLNGPVSLTRPDLGPCWIWKGCKRDSKGYGDIRVGGAAILTHKAAFEIVYGPVPDGLELDHLCRVRACSNPNHLEAVSHRVNMLRAALIPREFCRQGHAFTPENTYRKPGDGRRRCRQCRSNGRKRA